MVARIGDDRVTGAEDRAERAQVGLMAGGEDERVLGAEPIGELALELDVQIDRAVQKAGAGQAGAVTVERIAGALLDALVAGQSQVIVGAEHDPALALHLDDGQGRSLEHAEVRQGADLTGGAQLLEALELSSLGKNIDRCHPGHRKPSPEAVAG